MKSCGANKLLYVGICAVVLAGGFAVGVPSQQKVDEVVADEIVQFEHGEDAESAVRVLKAQGVTDEMLGSAYLKIVRKKMFAVRRSVDAANLNNAMWGLSQYGTENQLTNLLYVAENATDEITVTSAVFAYHAREGRSPRFLDWAQRILRQPNRSRRIKNDIWSCLSRDIKAKECSEKCRSRILRMARESLETDLEGAFYPDRILAAYDAAYRTGTERRKIAEKVLSKQNLNEVVRRHFGSVTGKDPAK